MLIIAFGLLARPAIGRSRSARGRLFAAGLLLGAGVAIEYPGALGLVAVGLYAAAVVRPWPRLLWLAAGAAVPGLALAAYHTAAWGGPLMLPGHFSSDPPRQRGAFMGITWPSLELAGKILFSQTRGLFRHAPWLMLWLPGVILLARRPRFRAEAAACALVPLLYLWFNSSLTTTPTDWRAGWGIGPRHLVATLPFFALGVAALFASADGTRRAPRVGRVRRPRRLLGRPDARRHRRAPRGADLVRPPVRRVPVPVVPERPARRSTPSPSTPASSTSSGRPGTWARSSASTGLATLIPLAVYLAATAAWLVRDAARSAAGATTS